MIEQHPDVLNINQLCEILHIGKSLAYDLLKDNKIKSLKIGRAYKIPKRYLLDYLEM